MNPAKHLAICAEIQQLHQVRIAQLEAKQRTWVGLTDAEVDNIVAYPWGETKNWIKAIEDALKKKNT